MDHRRISGNEPSSGILSQTISKVENYGPKVQNQAEAKTNDVINAQNFNFSQF